MRLPRKSMLLLEHSLEYSINKYLLRVSITSDTYQSLERSDKIRVGFLKKQNNFGVVGDEKKEGLVHQ